MSLTIGSRCGCFFGCWVGHGQYGGIGAHTSFLAKTTYQSEKSWRKWSYLYNAYVNQKLYDHIPRVTLGSSFLMSSCKKSSLLIMKTKGHGPPVLFVWFCSRPAKWETKHNVMEIAGQNHSQLLKRKETDAKPGECRPGCLISLGSKFPYRALA